MNTCIERLEQIWTKFFAKEASWLNDFRFRVLGSGFRGL